MEQKIEITCDGKNVVASYMINGEVVCRIVNTETSYSDFKYDSIVALMKLVCAIEQTETKVDSAT